MCPSSWCTVLKSSAFTWMHIFRRTSSRLSIDHALAWQTTSRSAGLVKSERSQNVCGSGAKPRDVKKPSPVRTMARASIFCARSRSVRSVAAVLAGRRHELVDVAPLLRPRVAEQVRGNRPVRRHHRVRRSARRGGGARRRAATRRTASPAATDARLRPRTGRAACRSSTATSRRCQRTPARARPCWSDRRSGRSGPASAAQCVASRSTDRPAPSDRGFPPSAARSR